MITLCLLHLPVEDVAAVDEELLLQGLLQERERAAIALLQCGLQASAISSYGVDEVECLRVERGEAVVGQRCVEVGENAREINSGGLRGDQQAGIDGRIERAQAAAERRRCSGSGAICRVDRRPSSQ